MSRSLSSANGTQAQMTFLASSSNSGATARSRSWHRLVQLPQPVLARVHSLSCDSVLTPCSWIAWMMVPLVTPTQPQTVALSDISATSRPASAAGGGNSRCRRCAEMSASVRSHSM